MDSGFSGFRMDIEEMVFYKNQEDYFYAQKKPVAVSIRYSHQAFSASRFLYNYLSNIVTTPTKNRQNDVSHAP